MSFGSSFASTIVCQVGDSKRLEAQKVITLKSNNKNIESENQFQKRDIKYFFTMSDIFEKGDSSKVISKDALFLTTAAKGQVSQHMIFDGNNMMYFDNAGKITSFLGSNILRCDLRMYQFEKSNKWILKYPTLKFML